MLTIIGIIVFVIIGKFVYDTYLTGKTDRDWERFKNSEPEKAARFERNRIIDFDTSPKLKEEDARQSLLTLAMQRDCSPNEVKDKFQEHLTLQSYSLTQLNEIISIIKENKYKESKLFNIDPDDTPSAFLEAWAKEHINKEQNKDKGLLHNDLSKNDTSFTKDTSKVESVKAVSKPKYSGVDLIAMFAAQKDAPKTTISAEELDRIEQEALQEALEDTFEDDPSKAKAVSRYSGADLIAMFASPKASSGEAQKQAASDKVAAKYQKNLSEKNRKDNDDCLCQ